MRFNFMVSTVILIFVILELELPERTKRAAKQRRESVAYFFRDVNLRLGKDVGVGPVHGCILKLVPPQDIKARCLRDTPMAIWMSRAGGTTTSQPHQTERMNTLTSYTSGVFNLFHPKNGGFNSTA